MTAPDATPDPTIPPAPNCRCGATSAGSRRLRCCGWGWPGLLGWLLYTRASWNEQSDRADVREWIDNTRIFRKTLAELVREYVDLLRDTDPGADHADGLQNKRDEIEEHIRAMTEPTRMYSAQLPLFPEIYRLEVEFGDVLSRPASRCRRSSGIRRSRGRAAARGGSCARWRSSRRWDGRRRGDLRRIPAAHLQPDAAQQDEYRFWQTVAAVVLLPTTLFAVVLVVRFLQRERRRELDRWRTAVAAEHRERELLAVAGEAAGGRARDGRNSDGRSWNSNSTRRVWRAAPRRPRTRRCN